MSPGRIVFLCALWFSSGFTLSSAISSDRRKEVIASLVTCIDEARKSIKGWKECNDEADKLSKSLTVCTRNYVAMEKSCRAICGMER